MNANNVRDLIQACHRMDDEYSRKGIVVEGSVEGNVLDALNTCVKGALLPDTTSPWMVTGGSGHSSSDVWRLGPGGEHWRALTNNKEDAELIVRCVNKELAELRKVMSDE